MHAHLVPGIEGGASWKEGVRGCNCNPREKCPFETIRASVPEHARALSKEGSTRRFVLRDEMSFSFPILGNEDLVASLEELHVPLDEKALEKPAYESVKPAYDALVQSLVGVSWCVPLVSQGKRLGPPFRMEWFLISCSDDLR